MAYAIGNGITATFTPTPADPPPDPAVVLAFAVTGFSWDGGDRPAVDITTGASTRRKVLPGLASQETYTLSVKYDTGIGVALAPNPYSPEMIKCGSGALVISMPTTDDCTALVQVMSSSYVDLVSFNFSVELDGVLEGEVTFRARHAAF